jgi:hypothetical protein
MSAFGNVCENLADLKQTKLLTRLKFPLGRGSLLKEENEFLRIEEEKI